MKPLELIAILTCWASLSSCVKERGEDSTMPVKSSDRMAENEAVAYLEGRGHSVVAQESGGYYVSLSPNHGPYEITTKDALALNSIGKLVGLRTLPCIEPEIMEQLRVFPEVKEFAVHYEFPDESVKYLSRFPNVEKMTFWGDDYGTFEAFPALPKLKIFENEGSNGRFTLETAKRIAKCRNLEEIQIVQSLPQEGIEMLKSLPRVKYLEVGGKEIIDGEQNGAE